MRGIDCVQAPDSKPLAAVKTVLRNLTQAKGVNLLRDMSEIPASSPVRLYFRMFLTSLNPDAATSPAVGESPVAAEAAGSPGTPHVESVSLPASTACCYSRVLCWHGCVALCCAALRCAVLV
jgi:hypothetical protein